MFENENVIYKNIEGVEILQFKKLLEYNNVVTHGYCLGTNINFRTGRVNGGKITPQEYNKALDDYKSLCKSVDLDYTDLVKTIQTHTDNVSNIEKKKIEGPDFNTYKDVDGLCTNKEDIILSTTNADCILLLFFDPVKKVIANVHSGWKGTLQRISIKTIRNMKEKYGCNEKNILVCMCPSIRKCHFEVGEDVYNLFYKEFKDIIQKEKIFENKDGKWHIDTIEINRDILLKEGLLPENIIDSGICSVCNKEYMHSYRAEGEAYGLNTAIISLKEEK